MSLKIMPSKNPIQPIVDGRFKQNAIVRHLLDSHPACDLNKIHQMDFTVDDRQQFAQLIGYSLRGYGDLGYVDDVAYSTAVHIVDGMDEKAARIAALEKKLAEMRDMVNKLRAPMAVLFEMHPDDLSI